jgi:hypothetical protein
MTNQKLGQLIRTYIDRVVNRQDLTAVDELVSLDYRGNGPDWTATTIEQLRQFYIDQYRDRPDWHIDVQETVELGDDVVVRAVAGGMVTIDGMNRRKRLEWMTHYRLKDGLISETHILSVVQHVLGPAT